MIGFSRTFKKKAREIGKFVVSDVHVVSYIHDS